MKRKVEGSERNSSIEFTKSTEGKREREREIKCGGMIDDHDKRKFQ